MWLMHNETNKKDGKTKVTKLQQNVNNKNYSWL